MTTAIHVAKPEIVTTFLGRKPHDNYDGEIGNRYNIRMEDSRIRHQMGCNSIKNIKALIDLRSALVDIQFVGLSS